MRVDRKSPDGADDLDSLRQFLGALLHDVAHLGGEFASGDENQGENGTRFSPLLTEPALEQWEDEGGRFSRARWSNREDITSFERRRERCFLNRSRRRKTTHRVGQVFVEIK